MHCFIRTRPFFQVVTIAVYAYFVASLVGRQYLDPDKQYPGREIDFYFPFVSVVEFFFYMGWLKVAESLINPLGYDDQDFDTVKIVDRNFEIGNMMVSQNCGRIPDLPLDFYESLKSIGLVPSVSDDNFFNSCSNVGTLTFLNNAASRAKTPGTPSDEDRPGVEVGKDQVSYKLLGSHEN